MSELMEDRMYHSIVRRTVLRLFAEVSRGNAEPFLASLAPSFEHQFAGDTALGGSRRTLAATRRWYERLYRLLPDISFDVETVLISGGPWRTLVIAEWNESNSGTDGVRTVNHGIHAIELKWGRVARVLIYPDTVGLKATLDRLARAGNQEATAPPICDQL
jgi:ketosteroid isomerase-like protein